MPRGGARPGGGNKKGCEAAEGYVTWTLRLFRLHASGSSSSRRTRKGVEEGSKQATLALALEHVAMSPKVRKRLGDTATVLTMPWPFDRHGRWVGPDVGNPSLLEQAYRTLAVAMGDRDEDGNVTPQAIAAAKKVMELAFGKRVVFDVEVHSGDEHVRGLLEQHQAGHLARMSKRVDSVVAEPDSVESEQSEPEIVAEQEAEPPPSRLPWE